MARQFVAVIVVLSCTALCLAATAPAPAPLASQALGSTFDANGNEIEVAPVKPRAPPKYEDPALWKGGGIVKTRVTIVAADTVAPGLFKCDGSADQDEINLGLELLEDGGVLTLSAGTFHISGSINIPSNVVLKGQGTDETTLKLVNQVGYFDKIGFLRILSAKNVTLRALTLDGNKDQQVVLGHLPNNGHVGIYCQTCTDLFIREVVVKKFIMSGAMIRGGSELNTTKDKSSRVTITKAEFVDNEKEGLVLDEVWDATITNVTILGNTANGMTISSGSKGITISKCTIGNTKGCAINAVSDKGGETSELEVLRNTIVDYGKGGLCLKQVNSVTFMKNELSTSTNAPCLVSTDSSDLTVQSNICPSDTFVVKGDFATGSLKFKNQKLPQQESLTLP